MLWRREWSRLRSMQGHAIGKEGKVDGQWKGRVVGDVQHLCVVSVRTLNFLPFVDILTWQRPFRQQWAEFKTFAHHDVRLFDPQWLP